MGIVIVYELDCHCGGIASSSTLHVDQPEDDGKIHLDLEMVAAQQSLDCPRCNCTIYTGDLEPQNDDEDCPGPLCNGCGEAEDDCYCEHLDGPDE